MQLDPYSHHSDSSETSVWQLNPLTLHYHSTTAKPLLPSDVPTFSKHYWQVVEGQSWEMQPDLNSFFLFFAHDLHILCLWRDHCHVTTHRVTWRTRFWWEIEMATDVLSGAYCVHWFCAVVLWEWGALPLLLHWLHCTTLWNWSCIFRSFNLLCSQDPHIGFRENLVFCNYKLLTHFSVKIWLEPHTHTHTGPELWILPCSADFLPYNFRAQALTDMLLFASVCASLSASHPSVL